MRVTLSIDGELLHRARSLAERRGTSVDQLIREYLAELIDRNDRNDALGELERLWQDEPGTSEGRRCWMREELHKR